MYTFFLWLVYTVTDMQQFFNNRYVRLGGLTLGLSVLFYVVVWLFCEVVGLSDFPTFLQVSLSVLGAGVLVYRIFSRRIV